MIGEVRWAVVAVELLENAEPLACIGLQIEDSHLLARCDALAWVLGHLIGKPDLTGAQKQEPPFGCWTCAGGTGHAQLGVTIGKHVGRLTSCSGLDLREFVESKKRVAMRQRHRFQSVVRRAPAADLSGDAPTTPSRTTALSETRLADA